MLSRFYAPIGHRDLPQRIAKDSGDEDNTATNTCASPRTPTMHLPSSGGR